jgi:hypothetical protein
MVDTVDPVPRLTTTSIHNNRKTETTMKTTVTTITMTVAAAISLTVSADSGASLSNDQVAQAIAAGLKGKGNTMGLTIRDGGAGFMSAMHAFEKAANGYAAGAAPSHGFWLTAYTPLAWIQQAASDAAKEYRSMSADEVTDEMREDVFRVFVHPDTPAEVTARGMKDTSSVQHVVLRDQTKKIVIQPISKEPFTEESKNGAGATVTFTGVVVQFPMDSLREIRGPKNDKEFFITVVGDGREEKNFEVKKKHFGDLK